MQHAASRPRRRCHHIIAGQASPPATIATTTSAVSIA
jgi:hypothetical protein